MYILTSDHRQIVNTDFCERICSVEKPDAGLVIASYREDRPPVTIGRYSDIEGANKELWSIFKALAEGDASYSMEEKRFNDIAPTIKDARVKRKGGS